MHTHTHTIIFLLFYAYSVFFLEVYTYINFYKLYKEILTVNIKNKKRTKYKKQEEALKFS